jgi:hypothetical protein
MRAAICASPGEVPADILAAPLPAEALETVPQVAQGHLIAAWPVVATLRPRWRPGLVVCVCQTPEMAVIDLVPVDRMLLILQHTPGSPPGVIERLRLWQMEPEGVMVVLIVSGSVSTLQILPADGMPDLPATEALRA